MFKRTLAAVLLCLACLMPLQAEALPKSTESIIDHLEFLGYTCEKRNPDDPKNSYVLVKHETFWNFTFYESGNGIVMTLNFNLKPPYRRTSAELQSALLKIMQEDVWIPQLYTYTNAEGDLGLRVQTWFPDYYEKQAFTALISRWQKDTDKTVEQLEDYIYFSN